MPAAKAPIASILAAVPKGALADRGLGSRMGTALPAAGLIAVGIVVAHVLALLNNFVVFDPLLPGPPESRVGVQVCPVVPVALLSAFVNYTPIVAL